MAFEIIGKSDVKDKKDSLMVISIGYDEEAGRVEYGNAHIGGTSGELRDVMGGVVNINKRDNDVKDLLSELLIGQTDGTGDDKGSDGIAGIDGVELIGLDGDSFTIAISKMVKKSGEMVEVADTIVFEGAGVAKIIKDVAEMSSGADIKDAKTQFEIVDAATLINEAIGGTSGELKDVIGGKLNKNNNDNDIEDLAAEFLTGDFVNGNAGEDKDPADAPGIAGVELIDIDADSFAFKTNGDTILVINAAPEIASAATQADVGDKKTTGEIVDLTMDKSSEHIGGTDGELNDVIEGLLNIKESNNNNDAADLIDEFTIGVHTDSNGDSDSTPGIDGAELIGLDEDSITFAYNGDTIIVQHNEFDLL